MEGHRLATRHLLHADALVHTCSASAAAAARPYAHSASIFLLLPVKFRWCHGCRDANNQLLLQEMVPQNSRKMVALGSFPVTNHMRVTRAHAHSAPMIRDSEGSYLPAPASGSGRLSSIWSLPVPVIRLRKGKVACLLRPFLRL